MGFIMFIIQILLSIILPVWLYVWFSNQIKKQCRLSSKFGYRIPDINFLVKRWWAEWSITTKKDHGKNLRPYEKSYTPIEYKEPKTEKPKVFKDENSCNSVFFYGADQNGNSLLVKFARRKRRTAEIFLELITSDDKHFVLPDCPETAVIVNPNQEWSAVGLKIELLEKQQRWRVTYNGLLRNLVEGREPSDEDVKHIRLNFLFIANSKALKWPDDWSSKLHAHALAHEPWRSPQWMNKINLMDYTGFDQWGSMLGQITFEDSSVDTLYLRGICQRRWGKHESHEFSESIVLYGLMPTGTMMYLGASSTKHSFPQMRFGHVKDSSDKVRKVDYTDLNLMNLVQQNCGSNVERNIQFIAEGVEYSALVKIGKSTTFYCGQPWNWMNRVYQLKVELNGRTGTGLMQVCHSFNGPCQIKTRATKIQYLGAPTIFVQKDDYVLHFTDAKCQVESAVGGKAFSLAALSSVKDWDFVVPVGFCVTVFAFELQLQSRKELREAIDNLINVSTGKKVGNLQKECDEAVRIIESTPIIDPVKSAISNALEKIESSLVRDEFHSYAVRSSAVGEDSDATSAAGQNESYLGVKGIDNINKSVTKCWASLFSYKSVEYRKQHGLPIRATLGVCVQKMVNAQAAGVMFTRHPTTGDPSNIVITANYGLGETVVSATVEPDTVIVHRSWNNKLTVKSLSLGNKTQKTLMSKDGVVTIKLNEQEIKKVSTSEKIALRLATIGLHLENFFGSPRDVEWAIINEEIFLLQARPITSLSTWTDFEITHELDSGVPSDIDIMTFANVGEVFPNAVSPLSISTVLRVFNTAVATKHDVFDSSYLNITAMRCTINYFNSFLRLPSKNISIFNKVLDVAVCGKIVITPEIHKTAIERNGLVGFPQQLYQIYEAVGEAWNNNEIVKKARELHRDFRMDSEKYHTALELYNEINTKFEDIYNLADFHTFTSRVSVMYQLLAMAFLTKGYEDFVPDHFNDIAILLSSCNNILSTEIPIALGKIAKLIKNSGKVKEFGEINPENGIRWIKDNCPTAAQQMEMFFKEHGHRCIQELDLMSESWSFKPENLIATIQMLVKSSEDINANKQLSVDETVASLKTPKSNNSKWFLKKIVPLCRKAVTYREETKSLVVSALHKLKLGYRKLGVLMVSEEYLPNENLVFFLTHHEIGELLRARNPTLVQKAHRRRKIFPRLGELQYPEINTGIPIPIKTNLDRIISDDCVKSEGISVCGGSILGRACVIKDLKEARQIEQGDILITHSTDIGWTPYFPLLGGIVTELGGLISHGAVVAREYGLPCIVGANGATQIFQTGDIILLAADIGVLQMVKKNSANADAKIL